MNPYALALLLGVCILAGCQQKPATLPCTQKTPAENFLSALSCPSDFAFLQGAPLSQHFSQVDAIKLVYDLNTNNLYFIHTEKYPFHYAFCSEVLHYSNGLGQFNTVEYGHKGMRRFLLANLNHYRASQIYTLEFFADDLITPEQIALLYQKTGERVYFKDKLYLVKHADDDPVPPGLDPACIVSVDRLFANQQYQPMVTGRTYGYLQKANKFQFENQSFSAHDILLTDFLPNDLPFCQGIITAAFQTPLAHINILSYNRKTPNCAYKKAWNDPEIQKLVGKLVCYEVLPDTFYIREARQSDADFHWALKAKEPGRTLACDLTQKELLDIGQIDRESIPYVGAKAANFAEIDKIRLPDNRKIPLPEGAFAIPFYFYHQHLVQNGLQAQIDAILNSDSICYNRSLLEMALNDLRKKINAAPLDPRLLKKVTDKLKSTKGYSDFRFRSSTNAEDIQGFTGAGLYDSKTGSLTRADKSIDEAIKKVWASLWSLRAFEERMNAHIDQSSLAMGVLVHRAFGAEEANGVAITRDLYRADYPAFTVNTQIGESSVVLPENQATPEQLLIKYSRKYPENDKFIFEYISHSSLNDYKPIMQDAELRTLTNYLYAIKERFYYARGGVVLGPDFYNFAMDIEFKLDKSTRKIYIKQARPY
ncbi:MAG: hypothetical protein KGS48_15225 [Bacteroidetes bacterium]|nr:hypothetical protein [Bacteroidota bacterium]